MDCYIPSLKYYPSLSLFESLLIGLHSRCPQRGNCLIGTTKRVTGCQLPSIKVLRDGRPTAKLHQICHRGSRAGGTQLWPITHSTACQHLVPGGPTFCSADSLKNRNPDYCPPIHIKLQPCVHLKDRVSMFLPECQELRPLTVPLCPFGDFSTATTAKQQWCTGLVEESH